MRKIQLSFGGGEISPEMMGRIDDAKYQGGLERCRNFIVRPQGAVENRAGFQFVSEVKDSSKKVRLIPFTFSTTQTMIIEMGEGYFRFHTQGATLLNEAGEPYEVPTPYPDEELFDIHYVQSADVLTLVHPKHAPRELRRLGATQWELKEVIFTPLITPPGGVKASAQKADTNYTYNYVVTAVAMDGQSESVSSSAASCLGNVYATGNWNNISWEKVSGALHYNVYKQQGGIYGFIGQTTETSIKDDNIAPDMSITPPIHDTAFQGFGIESVPVLAGGSGYVPDFTGGNIVAVQVTKEGRVEGNKVKLDVVDPTGSGATFEVITEYFGFLQYWIKGVKVVNEGKNYSAPIFKFTSSGGDIVTAPVFSAKVTPMVEREKMILVTDPMGQGAELSPVVKDGAITAIKVVSPGHGYTKPTISLNTKLPGSGAVFGAATLTGYDAPGAVSYFEQRRCFAGTRSKPQSIWMTKSGTEANMSYSLPTKDDDRISFKVAAREANTIRHIVPLTQLLLLTGAAEWRVTSVNSDAVTPSTISVSPQSYVGASNVQPVIINNSLIYGAARGGHVREMAYNWQAGGFISGDLSLRASHLFDTFEISDMAYAKAPIPMAWFVSSSGRLLGLTYVPEQQVGAWHWHDTDGAFESCAVVAEGSEDVLYCVIQREVNGRTVRYVERMASRLFAKHEDAFFVDSGLTYEGEPVTVVSGLHHLEGKKVSILGDGAVFPQAVVRNGQVEIDHPARKIQIGLPIVAEVKTLPFSIQMDYALGQGRLKNVNQVWLRTINSSGIFIGSDEDRLTEVKQRTTELFGTPPKLKTEEIRLIITPAWNDAGSVFVQQLDPLPLSIVNMTAEVAIGS